MRFRIYQVLRPACLAALLSCAALAPSPARADFFDNVRRTFQTDIPHFFQDDIPCAFGGRPTSGTRTSCRSGSRPAAEHAADVSGDHVAIGSDVTREYLGTPQNASH